MSIIADILLFAGALGAAFYCWILGRRLRRFTDLEKGVGGAVAVLSAQVDDLSKAVEQAKSAADSSVGRITEATKRAETSAQQLELLMASLHDLPTNKPTEVSRNPFFVRGAAPENGRA